MSPVASPRISPANSRMRLFAVLGGLYLAQGIPTYLFAAAIPPILREQGVSRTAIGMLSLLMLPLVLKFLWAPLIDRYRPFARAHRASWVIITQLGIIAALLGMLVVKPTDVMAIFWIGFFVAMLLSAQDIATDGYAAKYLDPAGTAEAALSKPSIRNFLARPEARRILWIALVYRASEGLVKSMEGAYLVDAGVPLDWIGYLSGGAAVTVGLGGSFIAALLLHKYGSATVLALLGGLRTICFAIFMLHAFALFTGAAPIFGASFLQTMVRYMEIVALYSLFMSVTSSDQPGTDFTILSCAQLIVYLVGSMLAGRLADLLGYGPLFVLATAISGLAVIMTYGMLRSAAAAERQAEAIS